MLIIKGETVIPADGKAMLDETTLYVEGARTVAVQVGSRARVGQSETVTEAGKMCRTRNDQHTCSQPGPGPLPQSPRGLHAIALDLLMRALDTHSQSNYYTTIFPVVDKRRYTCRQSYFEFSWDTFELWVDKIDKERL